MQYQAGAGRSQDILKSNLLGEREPGANPGQACCCNGPEIPTKLPLRKREGVGTAEARRPAEREASSSRPRIRCNLGAGSSGSRLRPFFEGHDREPGQWAWTNSKRTAVVMSWSGGKDSAPALHELQGDPRYEVVALMTSVSEEFRRVSHHGVREELLEAQADAIGLPLTKIYLPSGKTTPCTNEVYEEIMARVMEAFRSQGVYTVGFGDLFLEDLRAWRENNLAGAGMTGVFPIWKRDTR